jgi:hypothetical protein
MPTYTARADAVFLSHVLTARSMPNATSLLYLSIAADDLLYQTMIYRPTCDPTANLPDLYGINSAATLLSGWYPL